MSSESYENKVLLHERVSNPNCSITPLTNGQTFVGQRDSSDQPYVAIFCETDKDGILYLEFSNDDITWYTMYTYDILADTPEVHVVSKQGLKYFRTRLYNNSGSSQTSLILTARFVYYPTNIIRLGNTLYGDTDATATHALISGKDSSGNIVDIKLTSDGYMINDASRPKATRKDDAGSSIVYYGYANPGTATSAASWRIMKMDKSADPDFTITWADGNDNYDNIWDNRASLTYS